MVNQIKVGDEAPQFTLPDTNLKQRSLKQFLGKKTVIAFFVGAFTSVCTKEMCAFRDSMARLIDLKAQVIGISVNDPFSNKAFAEKKTTLSYTERLQPPSHKSIRYRNHRFCRFKRILGR